MSTHTYGYSDENSNVIGYRDWSSDELAREWALEWLEAHPDSTCVEVWLDVRDENGELPESFVVTR